MNELNKNEIIEQFTELDFVSQNTDTLVNSQNSIKVPFADIAALGGTFSSFFSAFTSITTMDNGEVLYRAITKDGSPIKLPFLCKEGASGFAPGIRTPNGLSVARFQEVQQTANANAVANVTTSASLGFMSIALVQINHKLDDIKQTQEKIVDILLGDKKAQQQGDFNYLSDLLHDYKYNWDDSQYLNNAYLKVEDIKRASLHNLTFYKTRILSILNDSSFIKTHRSFNEKMSQLNQMFEEYRAASFLYAYTSFVGAVILGNFSSAYVDKLYAKINKASQNYRETYTKAYNLLEQELGSTIDSHFLKGVSNITKAAGIGLSKIPILNRSQLDENIVDAADNLNEQNKNRTKEIMSRFVNNKNDQTNIFSETLKTLDHLYNDDTDIYFDRENLYLVS